jgi:putative transposase
VSKASKVIHLIVVYCQLSDAYRKLAILITCLYLKGLFTGGFQEVLSDLVGEQANVLSANSSSRLKADLLGDHQI